MVLSSITITAHRTPQILCMSCGCQSQSGFDHQLHSAEDIIFHENIVNVGQWFTQEKLWYAVSLEIFCCCCHMPSWLYPQWCALFQASSSWISVSRCSIFTLFTGSQQQCYWRVCTVQLGNRISWYLMNFLVKNHPSMLCCTEATLSGPTDGTTFHDPLHAFGLVLSQQSNL